MYGKTLSKKAILYRRSKKQALIFLGGVLLAVVILVVVLLSTRSAGVEYEFEGVYEDPNGLRITQSGTGVVYMGRQPECLEIQGYVLIECKILPNPDNE